MYTLLMRIKVLIIKKNEVGNLKKMQECRKTKIAGHKCYLQLGIVITSLIYNCLIIISAAILSVIIFNVKYLSVADS